MTTPAQERAREIAERIAHDGELDGLADYVIRWLADEIEDALLTHGLAERRAEQREIIEAIIDRNPILGTEPHGSFWAVQIIRKRALPLPGDEHE